MKRSFPPLVIASGWLLAAALLLLEIALPCAAEQPPLPGPPEKVVKEFKLSPFYKKCIVSNGFPVVSSEKVSDAGLAEAENIVNRMLAGRDDIRAALVRNHVRLAVMAPTEFTLQVPEHSDLTPAGYWNKRARGLGATKERPCVSCAEENLLECPGDPYVGENILVHEFAHAIHEMGMSLVDPTFDGRLKDAYQAAMKEGLWKNTYATTNRMEYWAEGVQSWFHCNRTNVREHNHVGSREVLRDYDPRLARLIQEVFRDNPWNYVSVKQRTSEPHLAKLDRSKLPEFKWPKEMVAAFEKLQQEGKTPESRAAPKNK